MAKANENRGVPRKIARLWTSAVGADAPTLDDSGICANKLNCGVISTSGTLVVLLHDGSTFTYSALDIISEGGEIEGHFVGLVASGSVGIYNIKAKW